ncbi:transcriptional regulator [Thermospira aquatica]|uniref:Transcriptional regulator n=1 Tax=Thermospira aquatica TaxID=2828656 RepID=A0AAX3BEY3_9SPIR|nr:transcriptional regulator [Thermospira aquatica]URA10683.1 transcriptional regulator [Thermospira aquatica]
MDDSVLDPLIHERARLFILTALLKSEGGKLSFSRLKKETGLTSGNLWVQMKRLEEAGYVQELSQNKRTTEFVLTEKGIEALEKYFSEIRQLFGKEEKK